MFCHRRDSGSFLIVILAVHTKLTSLKIKIKKYEDDDDDEEVLYLTVHYIYRVVYKNPLYLISYLMIQLLLACYGILIDEVDAVLLVDLKKSLFFFLHFSRKEKMKYFFYFYFNFFLLLFSYCVYSCGFILLESKTCFPF